MRIVAGPKYALWMLGTLGAYVGWTVFWQVPLLKEFRAETGLFKRHEAYMLEQTQLYEPVKQFSGEPLSRRIYFGLRAQLESIGCQVQRMLERQALGQYTIYDLGMGGQLIMAARDVMLGVLSPGAFLSLYSLFQMMGGSVLWLGFYIRAVTKALVDMEDLYHMLKTDPVVSQKPAAREYAYDGGRIKFKDITFKHYYVDEEDNDEYKKEAKAAAPPALYGYLKAVTNRGQKKEMAKKGNFKIREKVVLNKFSLEIEPGTTNAIVGPSGFGKTTLFNLLLRIYDP